MINTGDIGTRYLCGSRKSSLRSPHDLTEQQFNTLSRNSLQFSRSRIFSYDPKSKQQKVHTTIMKSPLSSLLLLAFATPLCAGAPQTAPAAAADPTPYCPSRPATNAEQTAIFTEFLQSFLVKKDAKTAFLRHMAENYIQHNPMVLSGRQVAIDGLSQFIPQANFTILRQAVQNNVGFVHYKNVGVGMDGKVVMSSIVDILRFEGTCIVEHWDLMGVKTGNETNPLAYF